MQELCLSLCSFHIEREVFPLFLLVGFEAEKSIFTSERFDFELQAGESLTNSTLHEALLRVHQQLVTSDLGLYKWIDNTEFNFRKSLQSTLAKLQNRVFSTSKKETSDENFGIILIEEKVDKSREIPIDIFRFCFYLLKNLDFEHQGKLITSLWQRWQKEGIAEKLVKSQEQIYGDETEYFKSIDTKERAENYLEQITTVLSELKAEGSIEPNKAFASVSNLLGLLMLKLTPSVDAALFAYYGGVNADLNIKVESVDSLNFILALQASLAFSIAIGSNVRLGMINSTTEAGIENVKGVIFPRALAASGQSTVTPEIVFLELVRQYLPAFPKDSLNEPGSLFKDGAMLRALRRKLIRFEDNRKNAKYLTLSSMDYGFIAFKHLVGKTSKSDVELIEKIENAINQDSEKEARVPFVVLSEHSEKAKQPNFSVSVSREICELVNYQLLEISQILQGKSA